MIFDTKIKEETVTIDGEELTLREPSAKAGFAWRNARQDRVKRDEETGKVLEIGNLEECNALLVSQCIFKADGTQAFTEEQVAGWPDGVYLPLKEKLDEWREERNPKKSKSSTPTA